VPQPGAQPRFGDYIVYVDESGDHALDKIDPNYPVFVLAFCLFHKQTYAINVCPAIQQLKFQYFGEDTVILHERDIRKASGPFSILQNAAVRATFMEDINDIVVGLPMTLIAVVIRKDALTKAYNFPENPYELAVEFGLERLGRELTSLGQAGNTTHVIFECRGAKEDKDLELAFHRVLAQNTPATKDHELQIVMCGKEGNAAGMQIADLIARPIGRKVIDPKQANRAYDLIEAKFRRSTPFASALGWGLKIFPRSGF
jgi:hypothetical protein